MELSRTIGVDDIGNKLKLHSWSGSKTNLIMFYEDLLIYEMDFSIFSWNYWHFQIQAELKWTAKWDYCVYLVPEGLLLRGPVSVSVALSRDGRCTRVHVDSPHRSRLRESESERKREWQKGSRNLKKNNSFTCVKFTFYFWFPNYGSHTICIIHKMLLYKNIQDWTVNKLLLISTFTPVFQQLLYDYCTWDYTYAI